VPMHVRSGVRRDNFSTLPTWEGCLSCEEVVPSLQGTEEAAGKVLSERVDAVDVPPESSREEIVSRRWAGPWSCREERYLGVGVPQKGVPPHRKL